MVFGLILLLAPFSQPGAAAPVVSDPPSAIVRHSGEVSSDPARKEEATAAPELKDAGGDAPILAYQPGGFVLTLVVPAPAESSSLDPIGPRNKPLPLPEAPRPMFRGSLETPARRHAWYALAFAGHGAAAFDAWSTRRAISNGAGTEANPLLRPFAHSGALYVATQVSPALMDYFGRRMMRSSHPWVRKMWWLPQSAGTAMSLAAGVHNVGVVK